MNENFRAMNGNPKLELEKYLKENLETISDSNMMLHLIQEYMEEKDEEKKKRLFMEIMNPPLGNNNPNKGAA